MSCGEKFVSTVTITTEEYNNLRDKFALYKHALSAMISIDEGWNNNFERLQVEMNITDPLVRGIILDKFMQYCKDNQLEPLKYNIRKVKDISNSLYTTYAELPKVEPVEVLENKEEDIDE